MLVGGIFPSFFLCDGLVFIFRLDISFILCNKSVCLAHYYDVKVKQKAFWEESMDKYKERLADTAPAAEVVERARQGDKDAFAQLYAEVYEALYRMALFRLGRRQDAEDAVSEAVVDAYRQIRQLQSPAHFKGWIFAILSRKCYAVLRKRYERDEVSGAGADAEEILLELPADDGQSPEGVVEKIAMEQMLSCLSEEEREILGMYLYSGYGSREVAEALQMNHSTVRSKIRRAIGKLRAYIA